MKRGLNNGAMFYCYNLSYVSRDSSTKLFLDQRRKEEKKRGLKLCGGF